MKTISNRKCNLAQKPKASSEVKELQTLTITELDAIAGAGIGTSPIRNRLIEPPIVILNHNETIQKPKAPSENKPKELQTLTIAELDAIAGAGLQLNHNETMI